MSLTYNEFLMLAVPIIVGLLAGLTGWWNYAKVTRRRTARKAAEATRPGDTRAFLMEESRSDTVVSVVELSPGETDALRSMIRGKAVTRLQQADPKTEAVAP